jgi:hypothetical protein
MAKVGGVSANKSLDELQAGSATNKNSQYPKNIIPGSRLFLIEANGMLFSCILACAMPSRTGTPAARKNRVV